MMECDDRKIEEIFSPMQPLEAALLLVRMVSSASLGDGYLPALLGTGILDAASTEDVIKVAREILGRRMGDGRKGQNPVAAIISYLDKQDMNLEQMMMVRGSLLFMNATACSKSLPLKSLHSAISVEHT